MTCAANSTLNIVATEQESIAGDPMPAFHDIDYIGSRLSN